MVIDHQGHYYAEVQGSPIPFCKNFWGLNFSTFLEKKLNRFSKKVTA